jgi:DNA-binding transcriptional MerR regulator
MENNKDLALEIIELRSRRLELQRLMLSEEWKRLSKEEQDFFLNEAKEVDKKLKELLKILNSVGGG